MEIRIPMKARFSDEGFFYCPACLQKMYRFYRDCPCCGQPLLWPQDVASQNERKYPDCENLEFMISMFDKTPAPEIQLDVNQHMQIYNWLQELKLYRQIGTLKELGGIQ